MYEYISQIDITDKFNYVLLILGIIFFTNRVAPSPQTWLGLLVGLVLVYYLNSKTQLTENAFIQSMEKILADPIFRDYKNLYKHAKQDAAIEHRTIDWQIAYWAGGNG